MLECYAIFDKKVGRFNQPFFVKHAEEVNRGLIELMRRGESGPAKYAGDFAVYKISTFDDIEGKFLSQKPEHYTECAAFAHFNPANQPGKEG